MKEIIRREMVMMVSGDIAQAVKILRDGGLVAFPTETVYGLGADARNEKAIGKIFAAKGRPLTHPLIVHLGEIAQLTDWACEIPPHAYQLAEACWPGSLTMILKKKQDVSSLVTGGQETIGLRIPNHPVALTLLKDFASGIVAPSANKFTHLSPTTAEAVQEELGANVDLILQGGSCAVGLESTIVDMTQTLPRILRLGMLSQQKIANILGMEVKVAESKVQAPRAPGMHHVHYAPLTPTYLMATEDLEKFISKLSFAESSVAVITHSDIVLANNHFIHHHLSSNIDQYAHNLYHTLRQLDHLHLKKIIIEKVPLSKEWDAIRDRLQKASAGRDL